MRLFNFLNESRSQVIDKEKAIGLIKQHCMMSLTKGTQIYRGHRDYYDDFLFIDPSKGEERTSPYASNNYYNLLFSNLPSWNKYPKRNKSVICTTDYNDAKGRSNSRKGPYIVLPFDNSKIGVCSVDDIWESFEEQYYSLNDFNRDMNDIFYRFHNNSDSNFNIFKENCENLDIIKDSLYVGDLSQNGENFFGKWRDSDIPLLDFLNDKFDPDKNGFKLKKTGDDLPEEREVWTDGKCVLIESRLFDNIKKEILGK